MHVTDVESIAAAQRTVNTRVGFDDVLVNNVAERTDSAAAVAPMAKPRGDDGTHVTSAWFEGTITSPSAAQ